MRAVQPAKIYIDGRFYKQPLTGVQRYGRELTRCWDDMLANGRIDPEHFRFELLVPRHTEVPKLRKVRVRAVGVLQGHAWTQLELPYWSRDGLLFSPSNILPLVSTGRARVVTIHSLAHLTVSDGYSSLFRTLYKVLIPRTLATARAVITVSQAEKHNIVRHYPGALDRIAVVHHGVRVPSDDAATRKRVQPRGEQRYALWVGTMSNLKNPRLAIEAVGRASAGVNLRLVMAGGSYRGLRSVDPRLETESAPWLSCMGPVDSSRLDELYRGAFCLLITSRYESFGFPAVEAMARGCPVVASDLPALREVCGDAALYCRKDRADDFDATLRRLASDDTLRQTLIQRGLRRSGQFTWESCALGAFRVIQAAWANSRGAA
jgi:glycosyltransferase involved in cell wall biosynthesis